MPPILTTQELEEATAGGYDYIRTKDNIVLGLAINRDLNRTFPEAIVFGGGSRRRKRAELFLNSGVAVPAYVKRDVDEWEFAGVFRATRISEDPAVITQHSNPGGNVEGVLFLERAEPDVQRPG